MDRKGYVMHGQIGGRYKFYQNIFKGLIIGHNNEILEADNKVQCMKGLIYE